MNWIFLGNPPLYPSIDGWLLYRSNHLYKYILQTSRKKSPLDKVFYSKLFHTDSNKANVVGLKAWMNCGNLLDVEATGGSSKPSHEKDHTGLLLPKAFQLDILKKKRSWLIPSFLSFLNHASKICLMILRLKALTNKQNFDHKYKNTFSVPFSCDFSHSHMFNFNEHNQCKSPKHKQLVKSAYYHWLHACRDSYLYT